MTTSFKFSIRRSIGIEMMEVKLLIVTFCAAASLIQICVVASDCSIVPTTRMKHCCKLPDIADKTEVAKEFTDNKDLNECQKNCVSH